MKHTIQATEIMEWISEQEIMAAASSANGMTKRLWAQPWTRTWKVTVKDDDGTRTEYLGTNLDAAIQEYNGI